MQTGEETAAAEEPILEEGSGREQVREGRSTRLFGVSSLCFCTKTVRGFDSGTLQLPNTHVAQPTPARSVAKHAFDVVFAGGSHVFSPLLNAWRECKDTKQEL